MTNSRQRWLLHVCATSILAAGFSGCAVTPQPLSEPELARLADATLAGVSAEQDPISGPISLNDAIVRALRYNLDHQVELAEYAVRERELDLAHYSLLPSMVANAGYTGRDSVSASSSQNVITGVQSLATSTSQDQRLRSHEAVFSWNILDFGLSYIRARQAADKALIQNELRRKITIRIIEDTRSAYWRAVSAQSLLGRLSAVEKEARTVERDARGLAADRKTSPITALTYEREIVEIQRTLGELGRELNTAKAQLAALMNVPPGQRFSVAGGHVVVRALPQGDMHSLIHTALTNRPELKEAAYKQRINQQEAHAALLELLPGLNLYAGANFDSNSFLLENHWQHWGTKASWNLLKVFSYPARRAVVDGQDDMLAKKSLAVGMSIMTQVYVARIRYAHAAKEHDTAKRFVDVQQRLTRQIEAEAAADRVSRQTLVRETLNLLVGMAKRDIAATQLESAFGMVQSSMGLEPEQAANAAWPTRVTARSAQTLPLDVAAATSREPQK